MLIVVRAAGNPAHILLSREGVTQGDPLAMILYGVAMVPLIRFLKAEIPEVIQAWYADDGASLDKSNPQTALVRLVHKHGPHFGYILNLSKCVCVVREEDMDKAKCKFSKFNFIYTTGAHYLGGFIGNDNLRDEEAS